MRNLSIVLISFFVICLVACGGGGSSVSTNPTNPNVNTPDIPGDNTGTKIVTNYFPSPTRDGTSKMGDGQIGQVKMLVNLADFASENDRTTSALTNLDREKVEATANAIAWRLYQEQKGTMDSGEGLGTWEHVFPWESGDSKFYRNVQAVTWLGLLQYLELYDLYDPADSTKTPVNGAALADFAAYLDNGKTPGFLGDCYNKAMKAHDTLSSTNADRPYAGEVILLSRAANVLNNPKYQYMAETWFAEIADEFTGAEFATRMINNRKSLALWDGAGYMWAATLTQNNEFVDFDSSTNKGKTTEFTAVTDEDDGMLQEYKARESDWENVLYSGSDYTNLGWCYLPAPLSELKIYTTMTSVASDYYAEALANLKGNTFRHRSYGYYGYDEGGRLYDDSQTNAYALIGLYFADQNDFVGTDVTIFGPMDGALEWFYTRIGKDVQADTDINLDGVGDAGAVRSQFRGNFANTTGKYNWEVMGESLSAFLAAEQVFSFPDHPLP